MLVGDDHMMVIKSYTSHTPCFHIFVTSFSCQCHRYGVVFLHQPTSGLETEPELLEHCPVESVVDNNMRIMSSSI